MNNDAPTTNRFEDRLLAAILEDFDNLTATTPTPGPGPARFAGHQRRSQLTPRRVVPALVATAAAAVVAVAGVAAIGADGPGRAAPTQTASGPRGAAVHGITQAQLVTYRLASASAAAPAAQGRYVVLAETDTETDEPGQSQHTSVIDTQTGASTTYQQPYAGSQAPAVLSEGPDPTSTEAWYAALPTDPVALRAQLLALAKRQVAAAAAQPDARPGQAALPNAGQPLLSDDDYVYQEADMLLWNPLVQPDLRAALYEVIAATGGYTVTTNATDPTGRPAIAMTRTYTYTGVSEIDVTYENPTTGAVLAQVWQEGTNTITAVYQAVTSTDTIPPDPYAN